MFLKRSVLILSLVLTALTGSVAFADPADPAPDSSGSDSNAAWQMADAAVPDSPDYKDRVVAGSDDANAVWQATETSNPHSVEFKDRPVRNSRNPNADWEASEVDSPHNPQPGKNATKEDQ